MMYGALTLVWDTIIAACRTQSCETSSKIQDGKLCWNKTDNILKCRKILYKYFYLILPQDDAVHSLSAGDLARTIGKFIELPNHDM